MLLNPPPTSFPHPSAIHIAASVNARTSSAAHHTRQALDAAAANTHLNAFTHLFSAQALHAATLIDQRIARGESFPLAGVPIAIKDNLCIGPDLFLRNDGLGYGGPTTCASTFLKDYHSPFTATAVQRLINAGAIIIGKTNMDEFGMGSSTENSCFGPTKNPHDITRVAGGSSGGSAAAVAAGICPIALGSDTGGSIRQPASHCGIIGLKPSYGRVSRSGLVAYASSLDQVGPLATNITDAWLAASIIAGHDPQDATTLRDAPPLTPLPPPQSRPLRVAVLSEALAAPNHPAVTATLNAAIQHLAACNITVIHASLPLSKYAIAAYYIIAAAEASSNLARFDGVRYGRRATPSPSAQHHPAPDLHTFYSANRTQGFGPEVQRRILLGTYVLSSGYYDAYYKKACLVRASIMSEYAALFATCDALILPASPGPAFPLGDKTTDPLAMYLEDVYTVGINLAGLPALSLPYGTTTINNHSLPIGLQLVAPPLAEHNLYHLAQTLLTSPTN